MSSFTSTFSKTVSELSAIPTVVSEQQTCIVSEEVGNDSVSFAVPEDAWFQDSIEKTTLASIESEEQIRAEALEEARDQAYEQEKKENLAGFIKASLSDSDIFPVVAGRALDLSNIEATDNEVMQAFFISLPDGAEIAVQFVYHCPKTIVVEKKPVVVEDKPVTIKAPTVSKLPVLVNSKIPVPKTSKIPVAMTSKIPVPTKNPTVKNISVPVVASKIATTVNKAVVPVVSVPADRRALGSLSAPPQQRKAIKDSTTSMKAKTSIKDKTDAELEAEGLIPMKLPISLTNRVSLRYQKREILHPQLWTEDGWF